MFPNAHLYITAQWSVGGVSSEMGQFGLRTDDTVLPAQGVAENCADVIGTFWASSAAAIASNYVLERVKFAIIGTDGKYPPTEEPLVVDFAPTIPGNGSSTDFPLQTAHVISLLTSAARGRAHRGRVYLPPLEFALTTQARWNLTNVNPRTEAFATMLSNINATLNSEVSVYSSVGAGARRTVTAVTAGDRPDVQRRRARQQAENYGIEYSV